MWKDVRGNQRPGGRDLNDLARRAEEHTSGGKGTKVARAFGGLLVAAELPEVLDAKITGAPTGSAYPWEEVYRDTSSGTWASVTGGRTGTASVLPAVERNGEASVPTNTRVELRLDPSREFYLFSYEPASGSTLATITVEDSHTTVTNVDTVVADDSTGLVVTDLGGGQAGLSIVLSSTSPPSWALRVRRLDAAVNVIPVTTIIANEQTGLLATQVDATTVMLSLQQPLPPPTTGGGAREKRTWRKDGRWYFGGEPNSCAGVTFGTVANPGVGVYYAMPLLINEARRINAVACWPTVLGTNAAIRLGIYKTGSESSLYPGALELDAGSVNAATGGGNVPELKILNVDHELQPGLYWLVMVADDDSPFNLRVKTITRNDQCWNLLGNSSLWANALGTDSNAQGGWFYNDLLGGFPGDLPDRFPGPAAAPYLLQIGAVADHFPAVAVRFGEPVVKVVVPDLPGGGVVQPGNPVAPAPQPAPQPVLVNPIALP